MFRFFKRREDKFQKLIEQQAAHAYEGMQLLVKYLESPSKDIAEELSLKEKEADEVRRILIDELNRTFITPFDHEDIFALSHTIDDVVDYADTTVSEMSVLNVKPTAFMQRHMKLIMLSFDCPNVHGLLSTMPKKRWVSL
jgi:uncharacterized protein Yka (UPF0111/DUF47 family)